MRARAVFPFYHLRGSIQLEQVLLAAGGSKGFLSLWRFPLHHNFHRNQCNSPADFLHKFSDLSSQSGKDPLYCFLLPRCTFYLCKMETEVVSSRKANVDLELNVIMCCFFLFFLNTQTKHSDEHLLAIDCRCLLPRRDRVTFREN